MCEPVPLYLKVRELEFNFALSKLLTTGVATNKRPWRRVWLLSILSVEVDLLHLDQKGREIQVYYCVTLIKPVASPSLFGVK